MRPPSRLECWRVADALRHDVRVGLRVVSNHRTFALVSIIALGLGIGANAAVYSTLRAMVLHPLAVRELDRILIIGEIVPRTSWEGNVAPANYRDLVQRSAVFERIAAFQGGGWDANVTGDGTPERLEGYLVTSTFFSLLGTPPLMGAVFPETEAGIGSIREAVISYSTWQNHFGADPHILGRTLTLNGSPVFICAVMPREFDFPTGAEIWAPWPVNASEMNNRSEHRAIIIDWGCVDQSRAVLDQAVRSGNVFSMYGSTTGVNWTPLGTSQTVGMPPSVYIGLAVSNRTTSSLATATFDNVSLTTP